jgi:hypothetical protein
MSNLKISISLDPALSNKPFESGDLVMFSSTQAKGIVLDNDPVDNSRVKIIVFFYSGEHNVKITSWRKKDIQHWKGTITITNE